MKRNLFGQRDHSPALHDHHAFLALLFHVLIHQEAIRGRGFHQPAKDFTMKEYVGIHNNQVVIERRAGDPKRRNTAAMELVVHQIRHRYAGVLGPDRGSNHLLLVAHDKERAPDIQTGKGFEIQCRLFDQDMREHTVICRAACELDEAGGVISVFGIFQDVTRQVNALRETKRGEARFRLLADNMGDVITRIRLDGRSGYISPGIKDLLGYRPIEMAGRTAQAFTPSAGA